MNNTALAFCSDMAIEPQTLASMIEYYNVVSNEEADYQDFLAEEALSFEEDYDAIISENYDVCEWECLLF